MTNQANNIDRIIEGLRNRINGFGYGMFLLVILAVGWLIIDSYGWPIGIFTVLLMIVVLEFAYQFYERR